MIAKGFHFVMLHASCRYECWTRTLPNRIWFSVYCVALPTVARLSNYLRLIKSKNQCSFSLAQRQCLYLTCVASSTTTRQTSVKSEFCILCFSEVLTSQYVYYCTTIMQGLSSRTTEVRQSCEVRPVLHRVRIAKLLTQHAVKMSGTHQPQFALILVPA